MGGLSVLAFALLLFAVIPPASLGIAAIAMYAFTTIGSTALFAFLQNAEYGKSFLQQRSTVLGLLLIPSTLITFFIAAPFAITFLAATIFTAIMIAGGVGSGAGRVVHHLLFDEKQNSLSAGVALQIPGSTAYSKKSLQIDAHAPLFENNVQVLNVLPVDGSVVDQDKKEICTAPAISPQIKSYKK